MSRKTNMKLFSKNLELEKKIAELRESIDQKSKEDHQSGEHLKKNPFIPEYLGFEETILKGENNTTRARIYTKDGYNISKRVDTTRNEWIVVDSNKETNSVLMESMYNAIVVLRACGMQISVYDYHLENRKLEKVMFGQMADDLNSMSENQ